MKNKILSAVQKIITVALIISVLLIVSIFAFWNSRSSHYNTKFREFLRSENDYYIYDSLAGHIHRSNVERMYHWEEHKKGIIYTRTNNLGFREDNATLEEKEAGVTRILVTGDSHIDGVVYNDESFPNQWEYLLNKDSEKRRYECINGGVGHFAPQNYSGFLKRFLYLKPDVYVVVVYTGNDFVDTLVIEEFEGRFKSPPRPEGYYEKMDIVNKKIDGCCAQAINQIYFFKTFPQLMQKAIEISIYHFEIIYQLCKKNNIKLLVLLLPTKLDVEMNTDKERVEAINKVLHLSRLDFGINRFLTEKFTAWLAEKQIDYIDLLEPMKGEDVELFWKKDYHLNDNGHKLIAECLHNFHSLK